MGSTIVLIEDEASIREIVRGYLERDGHAVHVSGNGRDGLALAERVHPSLVVLDLMLPDIAGEQVCARIRRRSDVPILILTAKASEADLMHGFRLGADDYLTKPFSPRELVVRVRAILRRTGELEMPLVDEVSVGDGRLIIDTAIGEVRFSESIVELTASEYRLIKALARYPGRVYSRYELARRTPG